MRTLPRTIPLTRLACWVFLFGLVASIGIAAPGCSPAISAPAGDGRDLEAAAGEDWTVSDDAYAERWLEVERLVDEQKLRAAVEIVDAIRSEAAAASAPSNWTRATVERAKLETALHGYEKAVRLLLDSRPPAEASETGRVRSRLVLDLYLAKTLTEYLEAYSWEISSRERVASSADVDLDAWTSEQILDRAHAAFGAAWAGRRALGSESLATLDRYLQPNNYPAGIRDTLRDAVTYLWVELLANSAHWTPSESNRLYRLRVEDLIALDAAGEIPDDASRHPVQRSVALLADLESWHRSQERQEAAFEARLARLRLLNGAFSADQDRALLRRDLERRLETLGQDLPWWSVGMDYLAELVQSESDPWARLRARDLAHQAFEAHPESLGGRRARHRIAALERPAFSLASMISDGLERRSVEVVHRNVGALHFRAFRLDLARVVETSNDFSLLPRADEIERILRGREPAAAWSVELPATPDLRDHRTYVTPPLDREGYYLIVASREASFGQRNNDLEAVYLNLTDLVLVTQHLENLLEVEVRSGRTGAALAGVEVDLYRFDYRSGGHERVEFRATAGDGGVSFAGDPSQSYFLLARSGDSVGFDPRRRGFGRTQPSRRQRVALLYTDRAVYRPGQKLLWKAVVFEKAAGRASEDEGERLMQPQAGVRTKVTLRDANGETVAEAAIRTNAFGSASGEFSIPEGRLLGSWRLGAAVGGGASVRVEEYKRPTFTVELEDADPELRLNRKASVRGSAQYYFGLPVVEAEAAWRVYREPVYPRWWGWYHPIRPIRGGGSEAVASGSAELGPDGFFSFEFQPEADPREAERGVTYRFRIEADVTDAGGETRSAVRSYRLGFVAVEARLERSVNFVRARSGFSVSVLRADLDGIGKTGSGTWRLVALDQPEDVALPADLPADPFPNSPMVAATDPDDLEETERPAYRTPGDALRPRWQTGTGSERIMRDWPDGGEVASGELVHDADGQAEIELAGLAAGAYRLRYRTEDAYGAAFETFQDFVVAAPGAAGPALPLVVETERNLVPVGSTARVLVHSGLSGQEMLVEWFRGDRRLRRQLLTSADGVQVLEFPVSGADRGGLGLRVSLVRDHQILSVDRALRVPWENKELDVSFASFRDRLRPSARERWTVRVRGAEGALEAGSAELLAYMYDRSLDLFAAHNPPDPKRFLPFFRMPAPAWTTLGRNGPVWHAGRERALPAYPALRGDRLLQLSGYGIGGPGGNLLRRRVMASAPMMASAEGAVADMPASPEAAGEVVEARLEAGGARKDADVPEGSAEGGDGIRSDFSETAFWEPHLVLEADGSVGFSFEVPDSVTEWSVWAHALTRDLRSGRLELSSRTVKELLVRPYLPRFLREGDRVDLRVVVQNAGGTELEGSLGLRLRDPETGADLAAELGLDPADRESAFRVAPGGSWSRSIPLRAPARLGSIEVETVGVAGDLSDGERRILPLVPGRMHLVQSRFGSLRDAASRELTFEDLVLDEDPTRIHDRLVVTLDTQLFYSVLSALPYLVSYPYECTEQTLNRFLSTGIVSSLYDRYPAVRRMAASFAQRETRFEAWRTEDANRRMALEETPWLVTSRGGTPEEDLINVLVPEIAGAQRRSALAKLEASQTASGGFPWFPGGPPSPYMTLYLLSGFSRALEFGVEVPRPMIERAWDYLYRHHVSETARRMSEDDCCWELVTFLNYVLSSYPDASWTGETLSEADRGAMLEFSMRHWREHAPLVKGMLALTLERAGRTEDAELVFDSVMDSARTSEDLGTYWAAEDKSWLWYNDTIEGHAFALRVLTEMNPEDSRRDGLVQWLLLNKKLNHWKSTRATAEVLYALVHHLEADGELAGREVVDVAVGDRQQRFVFEPDEYTGRGAQLVVAGAEIRPPQDGVVRVAKETAGLAFASATWHFSTERLPEAARGDLFGVERRYFRRVSSGDGWQLEPLDEGTAIEVGDQVEVQLVLRSAHAAEHVHLRDPRPAGFEPVRQSSGYRFDLGLIRYEEVRDSGMNFFFEALPTGEYVLRHRLRATMAGTFQAAPATLQSMYAPEFAAYSSGARVRIQP